MWHRVPIFPINYIFITRENCWNAVSLKSTSLYLNYREDDLIGFWTLGVFDVAGIEGTGLCVLGLGPLFWTPSSEPAHNCVPFPRVRRGTTGMSNREQNYFTSRGSVACENTGQILCWGSALPYTSSESLGWFLSLSAAFACSSLNWHNRSYTEG